MKDGMSFIQEPNHQLSSQVIYYPFESVNRWQIPQALARAIYHVFGQDYSYLVPQLVHRWVAANLNAEGYLAMD